jgi:hypothetical protein
MSEVPKARRTFLPGEWVVAWSCWWCGDKRLSALKVFSPVLIDKIRRALFCTIQFLHIAAHTGGAPFSLHYIARATWLSTSAPHRQVTRILLCSSMKRHRPGTHWDAGQDSTAMSLAIAYFARLQETTSQCAPTLCHAASHATSLCPASQCAPSL